MEEEEEEEEASTYSRAARNPPLEMKDAAQALGPITSSLPSAGEEDEDEEDEDEEEEEEEEEEEGRGLEDDHACGIIGGRRKSAADRST